jgi:NAD(P)H dehydrogenase (quinone)
MCSVTIGGPASMYAERGLNGPIESILYPVNHGILYFTGFTVVEPFLVHAPARRSEAERMAELVRYRERVLALDAAPTIAYPRLAEFDEQYVLKAGASSSR